MNLLGILLAPLVATLAASPPVALLVFLHREEKKFLRSQLKLESLRTQKMLNLMLAKDLPTLAGLNQTTMPTSSTNLASEFVSRDDATEYERTKHLVPPQGYGEALYDMHDDDPELNQAIMEMMSAGHIDYEENVT